MHGRISRHLSFANVASGLSLFLVLTGGGAFAAGLIGPGDIKDNAVRSHHIKNGEVSRADLRAGSVGSSEVVNDSLAGADISEETLELAAGVPWHEIGDFFEPEFNQTGAACAWGNFDGDHNSAAYLRDRFGFVHLKGVVDADDIPDTIGCAATLPLFDADKLIFNLPAGYRPAKREVFATITGDGLGRVNVDGPQLLQALGPGAVSIDSPTTVAGAESWISLDGISFRCAPPGQDGCP